MRTQQAQGQCPPYELDRDIEFGACGITNMTTPKAKGQCPPDELDRDIDDIKFGTCGITQDAADRDTIMGSLVTKTARFRQQTSYIYAASYLAHMS